MSFIPSLKSATTALVPIHLKNRSDGLIDGWVSQAKNVFAPRDSMPAMYPEQAVNWIVEIKTRAKEWNSTPRTHVDGTPSFDTLLVSLILEP